MRSYPVDSPQACARVLALALIADGGVSDAELASVSNQPETRALGIDEHLMQKVLQELCEDLQFMSRRRWGRELEAAQLDPLLGEVRDERCRGQLLALVYRIALADGRLCDGEGRLLAYMNRRWRAADWAIAA